MRRDKLLELAAGMILLLLACTGCGYRLGQGGVVESYKTITIPYALCDQDGRLTNALIKQMSESGALRYHPESADLSLLVRLVKEKDKNIGFRYDRPRKKEEELLDTIVPTETRRTVWCEVEVVDNYTGMVLIGPARISASVEFDHDYYSSRNGVNIFSLGQLGDIDAAYDACLTPLYEKLAEKITDYVNNSW